ncbi:MAG: Fe-S cluster assembly scaffold protein NifU [Euryarchaeota archaeon]|nr:Fe-S cluster assembly scaffold protein NifU [Euryarchaeota archaeon]
MTSIGEYSQKVLDHFRNPRNVGEIQDPDGVGTVGNPTCGDLMTMYLKIRDNRIEDMKFQTFGCGAAIASSSMMTEMVKGKTLDEALKVTKSDIVEALDGLPPVKIHCSVLATEALHASLQDYLDKQKPREQIPTATSGIATTAL